MESFGKSRGQVLLVLSVFLFVFLRVSASPCESLSPKRVGASLRRRIPTPCGG